MGAATPEHNGSPGSTRLPGATGDVITTTFAHPFAPHPRPSNWDDQTSRSTADTRTVFDAFVRSRLPDLVRFGRALTGSTEAGQDLVQDALERTLLAWHRLDSCNDPEGYVRRTMVNRNISIWRKFGREHPSERVYDQGTEDSYFDDDLWQALKSLPSKQRAVIALRYYEDMSEADIARTLGCAVGTVKSQASKALCKLRHLVLDEAAEPNS